MNKYPDKYLNIRNATAWLNCF